MGGEAKQSRLPAPLGPLRRGGGPRSPPLPAPGSPGPRPPGEGGGISPAGRAWGGAGGGAVSSPSSLPLSLPFSSLSLLIFFNAISPTPPLLCWASFPAANPGRAAACKLPAIPSCLQITGHPSLPPHYRPPPRSACTVPATPRSACTVPATPSPLARYRPAEVAYALRSQAAGTPRLLQAAGAFPAARALPVSSGHLHATGCPRATGEPRPSARYRQAPAICVPPESFGSPHATGELRPSACHRRAPAICTPPAEPVQAAPAGTCGKAGGSGETVWNPPPHAGDAG